MSINVGPVLVQSTYKVCTRRADGPDISGKIYMICMIYLAHGAE